MKRTKSIGSLVRTPESAEEKAIAPTPKVRKKSKIGAGGKIAFPVVLTPKQWESVKKLAVTLRMTQQALVIEGLSRLLEENGEEPIR